MQQQIAIQIGSDPVPSSFCPISDKDWSTLVRLLHATIVGGLDISLGSATPVPDDRNKPWFRNNTDGTPDRIYIFSGGLWLAKHPIPPNGVMIYAGDPAGIPTFDGGTAGTATLYNGPFWQRLPNADGRMLIQSGTTPAPFSTVLTWGQTGGEEKHALTIPEMPSHTHTYRSPFEAGDADRGLNPSNWSLDNLVTPQTSPTGGDATAANATTPHNTLPLYYVVTFIQRTARQYYSVPG